MNPIFEKLEQQFEDLKKGDISGYDFFNGLWSPLATLKGQTKELLNAVYVWTKERSGADPANFGLATIALGLLAMHEDRIEDGLKSAAEAQVIFEDIKDEDGLALSHLLSAAFYRTLGNIELALTYQYSVWNQLKASGKHPFFFCASSYQLGELYIETGAYERAIAPYEDCSRAAEKTGLTGFQALALSGKAQAYHAEGKNDLAKEAFLKAISLLDSIHFANQLSRVMSDFGTFYLDEGQYDEAIRYHQDALQIRLDNKMVLASITNMIQLGKIYLLQKKKEEALHMWQKALHKAEEIKTKPKIAQLHELLSEYYQDNGDTEKSLYHFKTFHSVSQEVDKEDGEKKVKRAEILFAAEQTQKENVIIKAQKAEIERKNKELQETIDELTITKVSRRAKALTLLVAIVMIIAEEPIMQLVLHYIGEENFYFSMGAKILVILSLKPIDSAIEHYLLHKIVLKKRYTAETIADVLEPKNPLRSI